jgi:hypothetical protein
MKIPVVFPFLLFCVGSALAEEITLVSKDGRKISATLIEVHDDSVEFLRKDGKEFTIAFTNLDENTVQALKKIALQKQEAAIAEQQKIIAAEKAEQARIPKFPENPKTLEDLPEKVVIAIEDNKESFFKFDQVKTFFVKPTQSVTPADSDSVLSVSTAFGGGEIMTIISQNLTDKNISMKLIARTDKDSELPQPIELTVPSKTAKSINGVASAGYFAQRLNGNVTEIILYDFQIVP